MLYLKNPHRYLKHIIVIPLISSVIVPLLILDIWAEIYHRVCFPLCGIPPVKRRHYIRLFDRAELPYLNWLQKLYCIYCGYGNGVIRYWKKIAAETERYWCGIRHNPDDDFIPSEHQEYFAEYGNREEFEKKYKS